MPRDQATTEATQCAPAPAAMRSRIQRIALELFTENGYEATSLREIAERLNVTKAALYYHFKSKDEIIAGMVSDQAARIDELTEWAQTQPRTAQTRRELVRRYSALLDQQGHHGLMRFFERNQSSMSRHKAGEIMRERVLRLLDVLTEPDAALADQIRRSLAIFALHSAFVIRDPGVTDEQRRIAALDVALSLID